MEVFPRADCFKIILAGRNWDEESGGEGGCETAQHVCLPCRHEGESLETHLTAWWAQLAACNSVLGKQRQGIPPEQAG